MCQMIHKMLIEETQIQRKFNVNYIRIDDFRKQLLLSLLTDGKGQVIWSKSSPMQPEKLRQIVRLDGKKYMVHFWKNKVTDIYLMEKNRGL